MLVASKSLAGYLAITATAIWVSLVKCGCIQLRKMEVSRFEYSVEQLLDKLIEELVDHLPHTRTHTVPSMCLQDESEQNDDIETTHYLFSA